MLITTLRAEADALLEAVAVPNELTGPSRFQRVREALEAYSHAFMDRYTEDVIGNDGRYYQLTGTDSVLNHWHAGLSYVMRIEYPAATLADNESPQYLEDGVWQGDYEYNGESYLYLRNAGQPPVPRPWWLRLHTDSLQMIMCARMPRTTGRLPPSRRARTR